MFHSQKIDFEKYSSAIVFIMKLHINQAQETECSLINKRNVVIGADYMIYNVLDMQELDQYEVLAH